MIKSILVPVDGSENSGRAVLFVAEVAAKLGASVSLLNVLDKLPARKQLKDYLNTLETARGRDEGEIEAIRSALSTSGEENGAALLENAARTVKEAGVERVGTALEDGDPATVILRYIDTGKFDLVVMGRRGLGGLSGILMGSLSRKVANLADCAVVTVK